MALAIKESLEVAGVDVLFKRIKNANDIEFYDYDLFCIGFPSYRWQPPKPMENYLKNKMSEYRKEGRIKVGAPKIPGKNNP